MAEAQTGIKVITIGENVFIESKKKGSDIQAALRAVKGKPAK